MSRNALVVGISHYEHLPPLKASVANADAIAQQLEQNGNFNLQRLPKPITAVTDGNKTPTGSANQPVTQPQLQQALKQLFLPDSQQIPETALFYFCWCL